MKQNHADSKIIHSTDVDYLVFTASGNLYAIPHFNLVQIIDCPKITVLPNMPTHGRGVLDFQGKPVVLMDTRKIFGERSLSDEINELIATIKLRKQDHLNWVNKLKESVSSNNEITVEINPHKCAFGKWYDKFDTGSVTMRIFMKKFDKPHKTIHQLGATVKELIKKGNKNGAVELIQQAEEKELKTLIGLFDTFEEILRSFTYEYAILINTNNCQIALAADDIRFFDKFDEVIPNISSSINITEDHPVEAMGRKEVGGVFEDIPIINCTKLIGSLL